MDNFNLFIPITKVDEAQRLVYGLATAEIEDKSGEIFDYESSLPYYKEWSGEIAKASGGKSLGNVREMHTNIAAGKLTQISFNDDAKQIEVCAKIVDDSTWNKVLEGVLTGFSHGGEYVKRWKDDKDPTVMRYTARPAELSVVDNPCLGVATFNLIRADGSSEMRKFKTAEEAKPAEENKPVQPKAQAEQVWKATDGQTFAKKDDWRKYQLELEAKESDPARDALGALDSLRKAVEDKEAGAKTDDAKAEKAAKKAELLAALKKSFSEAYDAKTAIEALCLIECLISGEEWEEMMGEGEEGQIADLKEAVSRLKAFIAAEIMEGEGAEKVAPADDLAKAGARHSAADKGQLGKAMGYLEDAQDHHEDATKAHAKVGEAHEGLRDCMGKMSDCMKAISTDQQKKLQGHLDEMDGHMDKAEKHHGKVGKAHDGIAAAHDGIKHALKAVGATDGEKADPAVDMQKVTDELTLVKSENASLKTENADLKKSFDSLNAEVTKTVPELIDRIKKLEAQPMPAKGALFDTSNAGTVIAVKKVHEEPNPADAPAEANYTTNGMSPEAHRRMIGIK